MRRLLPLVSALLLLALLAACGQSPTGNTQQGARVDTIHLLDPDFPVLAAGMVVVDSDYVAPPAPLAAPTELPNGYYFGATAGFGAGEPFTVPFIAAADLPAETLSPGIGFLTAFDTACVTTSSNAAARVSEVEWALITIPAIGGLGPFGAALGITSTQEINLGGSASDYFGVPFITWIYATAATDIATPTGGCALTSPAIAVEVDLQLKSGWNQVAFIPHADETNPSDIGRVTLENSSETDLDVTFLPSPVI